MITKEAVEAFNSRLTVNLNNIKTMKPSELDQVKHLGSQAEALLKNKDLAFFIHQFKFERIDVLTDLTSHTSEDNTTRIAVANQLSGIDEFIKSLKRAVYIKNRVVSLQEEQLKKANPEDPII